MPTFGGEFIVGDTTFWLDHESFVEMAMVLGLDEPFMFTGLVDGKEVDRWVARPVDGFARLGDFDPDPVLPDILTDQESTRVMNGVHDDRDGMHLAISALGRGLDFGVYTAR